MGFSMILRYKPIHFEKYRHFRKSPNPNHNEPSLCSQNFDILWHIFGSYPSTIDGIFHFLNHPFWDTDTHISHIFVTSSEDDTRCTCSFSTTIVSTIRGRWWPQGLWGTGHPAEANGRTTTKKWRVLREIIRKWHIWLFLVGGWLLGMIISQLGWLFPI